MSSKEKEIIFIVNEHISFNHRLLKEKDGARITYQSVIFGDGPNSTVMTFSGCLTPSILREMASKLENELSLL